MKLTSSTRPTASYEAHRDHKAHSELGSSRVPRGPRQATRPTTCSETHGVLQNPESDKAMRPRGSYEAFSLTKVEGPRRATRPIVWQSYKTYGVLQSPGSDKVMRPITSYAALTVTKLRGPQRATRLTASYEAHSMKQLRGLRQATRPMVWQSHETYNVLWCPQSDKAMRSTASYKVHGDPYVQQRPTRLTVPRSMEASSTRLWRQIHGSQIYEVTVAVSSKPELSTRPDPS